MCNYFIHFIRSRKQVLSSLFSWAHNFSQFTIVFYCLAGGTAVAAHSNPPAQAVSNTQSPQPVAVSNTQPPPVAAAAVTPPPAVAAGALNEDDRLARLENSIAVLLQEVSALRLEKNRLQANQQ